MMIGRCVPTAEALELKIDRGGSGWANPDQALFDRAVKAGVMIAKDPGVRFYGGRPMTGIGAGPSAGRVSGPTWEDRMAAKNAEVIQRRKKELWLRGIGNLTR